MFETLKRMNAGASTTLVVLRNDWSKKLETLTTKRETLEQDIAASEAAYRDAALAADEGGQPEAKKRDQVFDKLAKLRRKHSDVSAAIESAHERAVRDEEKKRRAERQQRETAISEHHTRLIKGAHRIDTALTELAAAVSELEDCCGDLRDAGVRPRTAYTIIPELPRLAGSHFLKTTLNIGVRHPFDTAPVSAVDRCPTLADVLKSGNVG